MERESIEYSWKWVTATELLSHGACEICNMMLTCEDGACHADIYDGENLNGTMVVSLKTLEKRTQPMSLVHHIYCRRGLFVFLDDDCRGLFIQWREIGHKGGES